jgi:hypothetical protein
MIRKIPDVEYRAMEGVNITRLKCMARNAKKYNEFELMNKPTPAMLMGTLIHTLVFSPEELVVAESNTVIYDGIRRGKKWEQFEMEHEGKTIVTVGEHERALESTATARAIAASVCNHPFMLKAMASGDSEVAVTWDQREVKCKGKLDHLTEDTIIDLKTTIDAGVGFEREIERRGYWAQGAWYQEGVELNGRGCLPFIIVAVEKTEPYDMSIWALDQDGLNQAREKNHQWLREVECCQKVGIWPGYPNTPVIIKRRFNYDNNIFEEELGF